MTQAEANKLKPGDKVALTKTLDGLPPGTALTVSRVTWGGVECYFPGKPGGEYLGLAVLEELGPYVEPTVSTLGRIFGL